MPRRIEEDHKDFRDVYGGRIRKELKKYINNGSIFRTRGDGNKINITIPRIDIPHIVYGENDEGIGRGEGDKGKVIGKDGEGKGKGNKAGEGTADGITISVDMEDVFKFLKDELALPDLKPKPNETFEEVRIKYTDISKRGPESLRHNRRTMMQAMKRQAATGDINKMHYIPGQADPVKLILPINSDRRYRQYREVKIPSSNALLVFGRDGSGSMDEEKCNVVSDMAWWIEAWVRRFYKRTETAYIWHDTEAKQVDQKTFYNYRYGGGTACSSCLKELHKMTNGPDSPYPPDKWNIYFFYFSDGDNYGTDNATFNKIIQEKFNPETVNFVGITQILSWHYQNSLKEAVDKFGHADNVRTTSIGPENTPDLSPSASSHYYGHATLTPEERDRQILQAIKDLMGVAKPGEKKPVKKVSSK